MKHGKLESLITIPAGNLAFAVTDAGGSDSVTLTAGKTYYWSSDGNDSQTLVEALQAGFDGLSGPTATYTVSSGFGEDGTGKLTISATATFSVVWTNTALGDLMGWTSSINGASSYTGTHVQGLWLPDCPFDTLYGASDEGTVEYDGSSTQSPDGVVVSTAYNSRTANMLYWQMLKDQKVRSADEVTTNESYQSFYDHCIYGSKSWAMPGGPVRWYKDADVDGTYVTYKQPIQQRQMPTKSIESYSGFYRVEIPRLVKVP